MKWKLMILGMLILSLSLVAMRSDFRTAQKKYSRVRDAYAQKEASIKVQFDQRKLNFKNFEVFLRALKQERLLQVFVRSSGDDQFKLLEEYPFCETSGTLGPKRKQGDFQIPEGFYHIDRFNPVSNYHLSLGINYPNASDRTLASGSNPGGDIFIHGDCVTIGCIPITDDKIKELYVICVEARANGQSKIPVHIFPSRLSDQQIKEIEAKENPKLVEFWKNLKPGYDYFEKHRIPGEIRVDNSGRYHLKP